jgi:predicted Zn-dependent peptidase
MGTDNSFEILTDPSREFIEKKSSSQTSIRIGKFCAKKQDVDFHKLFITNEILGGYFGSRLMQNIRENKGLTYGIYSNIVTTLSNGYVVIGADAKKELRDKVIEEVFEEIDLLTTKGVSEEELSTVRNYLFGEFLGDVNTPFNLVDKFKSVHLHGLGYEFYDKYFETLESITSREIQATAQKYLDKSRMVVIGVG